MKTEIEKIYDELKRNWDEYSTTGNKTCMEDAHPSLTICDWDYQFYFDEDGNVYALPNEESSFDLGANLDDTKDIVIARLTDYICDADIFFTDLKHLAREDARIDGEMQSEFILIALYEYLQENWVEDGHRDREDFDTYADEAIEEYVKAYGEYYGVNYKEDSWGNYKVEE